MEKLPRTITEQTIREDMIRQRAFEIYEQHRNQQGSDLDDWLEAEKEILEEEAKKAAV